MFAQLRTIYSQTRLTVLCIQSTNTPVTATLLKIETTPDLVDQVYRALLDAISEGSLAPGARITQEEIAEQLAVSRQPVLQALRLLKKDGFVLDAPGRGVLVAPLDAAWLGNVYQIRSALDALAARLACAGSYRVDSVLMAQGRKAARGKNIKAMMDADMAFHTGIYQAANNPLIEQSAQLHWRHIRRAMGAVLQSSKVRDAVWDEHEQIAQAIAAKKPDAAEKLMRGHGVRASDNLSLQLSNVLSRGDKP
jgi:DNA-binding GntR family transcriptional regulator